MAIADIGNFSKVTFSNGASPDLNATNMNALEARMQDIDDAASVGGGTITKIRTNTNAYGEYIASTGRLTLTGAVTVNSDSVANINVINCVTTGGDVTINGFANGVPGQYIFLPKITSANQVIINHNNGSGTQKIFTPLATTVTMLAGDYGLAVLYCNGTNWYLSVLGQGAGSTFVTDQVPTASPASGATGTAGMIRYDADWLYICTATNTWERAALTGGY
jgi:hypothetical protein